MSGPVNNVRGGPPGADHAVGSADRRAGVGRMVHRDLPPPTIVLIDLDGTMVLHRNEHLLTMLEIAETIGSKALRLRRRTSRTAGDRRPSPHTAYRRPFRFLGRRLVNALRRRPIPDLVSPAPGVFELLDVFKRRRAAVVVASNCLGDGYGELVLAECGFTDYVSCAVFREHVARSKPDPACLQLALERLGRAITDDDTIWCIGDRDKDMLAAQHLSEHTPARVVAVAYGSNARRALKNCSMTSAVVARSHHELRNVLELS